MKEEPAHSGSFGRIVYSIALVSTCGLCNKDVENEAAISWVLNSMEEWQFLKEQMERVWNGSSKSYELLNLWNTGRIKSLTATIDPRAIIAVCVQQESNLSYSIAFLLVCNGLSITSVSPFPRSRNFLPRCFHLFLFVNDSFCVGWLSNALLCRSES